LNSARPPPQRRTIPATGVYFVSPRRIASIAAALTCVGRIEIGLADRQS
jgi:hypothetical protein